MRTFRVSNALISVAVGLVFAVSITTLPAKAQTAADAALDMANMLDGAGGGISGDDLMSALEDAAAAGQPLALWQLGTMYENGEGVERDPVKAFGYFSQIANEHADAAPRSLEADIVAQSFVKVGEYYRDGLPGAGIGVDTQRSHALLMHAATYFGDADAQYKVGLLYLQEEGLLDDVYRAFRGREATGADRVSSTASVQLLENAVQRSVGQLDADFATWFEGLPRD